MHIIYTSYFFNKLYRESIHKDMTLDVTLLTLLTFLDIDIIHSVLCSQII